MSDEIIIGFDELSSLLTGETLHLDEDEHEVIQNADESVTIIVDPESTTIVEGDEFVGVGVSLTEDIYLRLKSLGYEDVSDFDKMFLRFLIDSVQKAVLNIINTKTIPNGLHYNIVDAVCAEFLKAKYALGKINVEFPSNPVTSIKEGDTTVSYGTDSTSITPQKVFLNILNGMRLTKGDLLRYRRFVW